jgi:response regulator RpfG family c-di-GMP phosphodiesterase
MEQLYERHLVVLVDDDSEVLSALRRSLSGEPYLLLTTNRPRQALRWVECVDVSAVVSDERMPEMTGAELLARIATRSPETARIMLTAYGRETARLPGLGRSAEYMVAKPWDDAMLRRAIRDLLCEREVGDPGREGRPERKGAT